ncbi:MAG: RNA polymerase sigma factor [Gammaproteobacteria bacterium]|nr:RNA polymerase sigma factor [Gammaproteobacteria bacterium]
MTALAATLPAVYSTPAALRGPGKLAATDPTSRALDAFLTSIERKAFKIARLALRHDDDALDAVQDAMLALVTTYARRPSEEWKPLFYRILENKIRDLQRRRTVRGRIMAWLPVAASADDDDELWDPLAQAASAEPPPTLRLELDQAIGALEQAIAALPSRQRQAFLLRNFEGLDVAATATAMGCSEGSVKTHYFRALQALRAQLGDFWT